MSGWPCRWRVLAVRAGPGRRHRQQHGHADRGQHGGGRGYSRPVWRPSVNAALALARSGPPVDGHPEPRPLAEHAGQVQVAGMGCPGGIWPGPGHGLRTGGVVSRPRDVAGPPQAMAQLTCPRFIAQPRPATPTRRRVWAALTALTRAPAG